jgi:hypothetical protein
MLFHINGTVFKALKVDMANTRRFSLENLKEIVGITACLLNIVDFNAHSPSEKTSKSQLLSIQDEYKQFATDLVSRSHEHRHQNLPDFHGSSPVTRLLSSEAPKSYSCSFCNKTYQFASSFANIECVEPFKFYKVKNGLLEQVELKWKISSL